MDFFHLRRLDLSLLARLVDLTCTLLVQPMAPIHWVSPSLPPFFQNTTIPHGMCPGVQPKKNFKTHLSHLAPGVGSERMHFAFAVAQAAQAAPHLAVGSLGRSDLDDEADALSSMFSFRCFFRVLFSPATSASRLFTSRRE